jgi:hypothetical protein
MRDGGSASVSEDKNPIMVIYTPTAQYIICKGCMVYAAPCELMPMPYFVLAGKAFLREHRFCKPREGFTKDLFAACKLAPMERQAGDEC